MAKQFSGTVRRASLTGIGQGRSPRCHVSCHFILLGQRSPLSGYPSLNRGVMKPDKKQPSHDDLAVALITQRGLAKIVKLQNEQLRRLKRAIGRLLAYTRLKLRIN